MSDAKRDGLAERVAPHRELTPPVYPTPAPPPFAHPVQGGGDIGGTGPATATGAALCEKFNPKPRFNDSWAAVLFVAHLAAFAYISYLGLTAPSYRDARVAPFSPGTGAFHFFSDPSALLTLLFSTFVAFVLSTVYFLLMERFPTVIIKATFLVAVLVNCAFALVVAIFSSNYSVSLASFAVAGVQAFCWFWWRARVPFASVMLQTVTAVSKRHKGMFASAVFGLCLEILYTVYFAFTLVGIVRLEMLEAGTAYVGSGIRPYPRTGRGIGLTLFAVFSFYWVTQVIKSIVHVTISGVFAAFYFLEGSPQGLPFSPTISSFKRAVSTSFGSVCLGSLIIALIKTANDILASMFGKSNNACGMFTWACGTCLVDAIDRLVQRFNHYAYTQVAIYGKDFCTAAKDTWKIIQDRGIEGIINDCLIGNVLTIGSMLVAMGTALSTLAFVALRYSNNDSLSYLPQYVAVAFLLGFTTMNLIGEIVTSGTATTFVALAEDPQALARTKPELYEKIRQTYPEIAVGI